MKPSRLSVFGDLRRTNNDVEALNRQIDVMMADATVVGILLVSDLKNKKNN